VGIVEFDSSLPGLSGATVEFGRPPSYDKRAPVDLTEPEHRTLLLGMKASTDYQLRVVARSSSARCISETHALTTGPLPNTLPPVSVRTPQPGAISPGYIISTQYTNGTAYILDEDGDYVWWFNIGGDVTSARMSFDAKHMWINRGNVPEAGASVHKVSMDGLSDVDLSDTFKGQHHQLAVLPDESVAFFSYTDAGCSDIKEYSQDGSVHTLMNASTTNQSGDCHLNAIEYSSADDTLIFSDLDQNSYSKITRSGAVVWILGGPRSSFSGTAATWLNQHGLHPLGPDRLLFFNNGKLGSADSLAVELNLDLDAMNAVQSWSYQATPSLSSHVLGDVQRLPNGNTLVVYSGAGVVHEVNASGNLLQEMSWSLGGVIGYAMKRTSLYGSPPK
jgi:hypothetical protein